MPDRSFLMVELEFLAHLGGFSKSAIAAYLVLSKYCFGPWGYTNHAWPSAGTIAKETGLTPRAVQKGLRELVTKSLIKHRGLRRDTHTAEYELAGRLRTTVRSPGTWTTNERAPTYERTGTGTTNNRSPESDPEREKEEEGSLPLPLDPDPDTAGEVKRETQELIDSMRAAGASGMDVVKFLAARKKVGTGQGAAITFSADPEGACCCAGAQPLSGRTRSPRPGGAELGAGGDSSPASAGASATGSIGAAT